MENSRISDLKWNSEVDAVIVGAGGAGLSAAIELADANMEVIVFEKQPTVEDSSTYLCGGVVSFAGTDLQAKQKVNDSDALLFKDFMETGLFKSNEKLVKLYVKHQLDTYKWLNDMGIRFTSVEAVAGMSVPRAHRFEPRDSMNILQKVAESKGVKISFGTSVMDLVVDEAGTVTGVSAKYKTGLKNVKARKGVILATGGFGRDVERLRSIDPRFANVIPLMAIGDTGDGHRMAEELGAFITDIESIKPTFGLHITATTNDKLSLMYYLGAIIVNKQGKRFVNESLSYKDVGINAMGQTDGVGIQIFDEKIYKYGVEQASNWIHPHYGLMVLDEGRRNLAVKADTIEELASKLKIPPKTLRETIERYNSDVDGGKDQEFGRTTLRGGVGSIQKIDAAPFYAFESKGAFPGIYAGIVVDEDMHVLTHQGIIPGLYAAGEIVGGFHGHSYMTGTGVGKALISGRVAGVSVAKGI